MCGYNEQKEQGRLTDAFEGPSLPSPHYSTRTHPISKGLVVVVVEGRRKSRHHCVYVYCIVYSYKSWLEEICDYGQIHPDPSGVGSPRCDLSWGLVQSSQGSIVPVDMLSRLQPQDQAVPASLPSTILGTVCDGENIPWWVNLFD